VIDFFRPTKFATRINQIDPVELRARGIRGAIVDLDNTLVGFRSLAPLDEDAAWVRRAKEADVRVAVLTNNGTPWASQVAKDLGVPCIPRARKPLPRGFRRAMNVLELRADEAAAPPGVPRQLAGAAAVSRQARTYSSRAPFGRLVLIDGAAGLALARRGRLWMALRLTVADGKITGIDVVADPDRLSRLTLALLAD